MKLKYPNHIYLEDHKRAIQTVKQMVGLGHSMAYAIAQVADSYDRIPNIREALDYAFSEPDTYIIVRRLSDGRLKASDAPVIYQDINVAKIELERLCRLNPPGDSFFIFKAVAEGRSEVKITTKALC